MPKRVVDLLEMWLPVQGWGGRYEVSSHGRVRRKRFFRVHCFYKARILMHKGRAVDLHCNGRSKKFTVAELVLTAFVGPRTKTKPIARHLDDNIKNNALSNLAWGTRSDNRRDAVRNGGQAAGSAWAKKVAESNRGQKRTKATKNRMKIARNKLIANGWSLSKTARRKMRLKRLGKKHTQETKDKIAASTWRRYHG